MNDHHPNKLQYLFVNLVTPHQKAPQLITNIEANKHEDAISLLKKKKNQNYPKTIANNSSTNNTSLPPAFEGKVSCE